MKKNIQLLGTTFITVLILLVSMLPLTACSSSQQYTYKSMDMNAILQKVGTKTWISLEAAKKEMTGMG